jgi:NAD(P)-dependent dehydrogenase (short-subunit alcohol dehydrogenase family)
MKTVVVTGANRGLGLALAKAFLQAGWKVVAVVRHAVELPANPNLQVEACDLTSAEQLPALVQRLQGMPVDILVNNAAVYDWPSPQQDVASTDFNQLTQLFQTNTIAPKLLADALVPNLQVGTDKLVVTMSSGMGTYAEFENYHAVHWAYSASKAAVNYAMVSFAELHRDIKSTLIDPGWMQTEIGGPDAPLSADESAANIFKLITEHASKLPNAKMVDYGGGEMHF